MINDSVLYVNRGLLVSINEVAKKQMVQNKHKMIDRDVYLKALLTCAYFFENEVFFLMS